jgi:hypothetical protein
MSSKRDSKLRDKVKLEQYEAEDKIIKPVLASFPQNMPPKEFLIKNAENRVCILKK